MGGDKPQAANPGPRGRGRGRSSNLPAWMTSGGGTGGGVGSATTPPHPPPPSLGGSGGRKRSLSPPKEKVGGGAPPLLAATDVARLPLRPLHGARFALRPHQKKYEDATVAGAKSSGLPLRRPLEEDRVRLQGGERHLDRYEACLPGEDEALLLVWDEAFTPEGGEIAHLRGESDLMAMVPVTTVPASTEDFRGMNHPTRETVSFRPARGAREDRGPKGRIGHFLPSETDPPALWKPTEGEEEILIIPEGRASMARGSE
eukprot:CAMPEP_0194293562 /NCGR_PEP_ID=MMETSP0169-20130528/48194_1 /TAXON_ID=218684 /ORGANISM="Corethron pennatum, Strain L29A3" /LENGTH=258 /DNA_ID=CAMNT_0039042107 /DNA_START=70 /DNA_END=844 /DNA_ORIENTATION=+